MRKRKRRREKKDTKRKTKEEMQIEQLQSSTVSNDLLYEKQEEILDNCDALQFELFSQMDFQDSKFIKFIRIS